MFSAVCEAHNHLIKRRDRTLTDFLYCRGGGEVILLMEQIPTGLGRIQLTQPASCGVYFYWARPDLTHSFRH
jgi:hypothetical protein